MALIDEIPEEYRESALPRQEAGAILANGVQVASTLQCRHCGGHFMVKRGSGIQRGWCQRCGGPTCGGPACENCLPFEKWLDEVERRATREYRLGA